MRLIDRYAYSNRIHRLHPGYKAACSFAAIAVCLGLNRPLASLMILGLMLGLTIFWARLPGRFVLGLILAEGSFLLFSVLGVAVSLGAGPSPGGFALGSLWVNVSVASLWQAVNLLNRALACAAAMNFLSLTTPIVDLMDLLRQLRVPDLIIDLMTLIYRFIFALLESIDRMLLAQDVRLGYRGWRNSLRSAAQIGANLFIEAFRRSQRLEIALQGRAWDGTLRVLPQEYEHPQWSGKTAQRAGQ